MGGCSTQQRIAHAGMPPPPPNEDTTYQTPHYCCVITAKECKAFRQDVYMSPGNLHCKSDPWPLGQMHNSNNRVTHQAGPSINALQLSKSTPASVHAPPMQHVHGCTPLQNPNRQLGHSPLARTGAARLQQARTTIAHRCAPALRQCTPRDSRGGARAAGCACAGAGPARSARS